MDKKFPKRINIKGVKTQYGEILQLGIHRDLFKDNEVEGDWFNLSVFRSKEGNKPYLVINDYKKPESDATQEEIPF